MKINVLERNCFGENGKNVENTNHNFSASFLMLYSKRRTVDVSSFTPHATI